MLGGIVSRCSGRIGREWHHVPSRSARANRAALHRHDSARKSSPDTFAGMTEGSIDTIDILAPAKLNLGLEIIGRRPDGYHELATIFLAVDLCDRLTFSEKLRLASEPCLTEPTPVRLSQGCTVSTSSSDLEPGENIVVRALEAVHQATGHPETACVHVDKRIPLASGLGGASSDAAATLIAARQLWRLDLTTSELHAIARGLGSDVPFFLRGGCAVGRGRGDALESIPAPVDTWYVLIMPRLVIPRKTASLYQLITPNDYSDGGRVGAQADRLRDGLSLDLTLLGNAFERPLYALVPQLSGLPDILRELGAPVVALSGAGPTHYVPFRDPEQASRFAAQASARLGTMADVARVSADSPLVKPD